MLVVGFIVLLERIFVVDNMIVNILLVFVAFLIGLDYYGY